jgi:thiamine pyrophosphate-dependent acetolactate synthase large subunit-like protein
MNRAECLARLAAIIHEDDLVLTTLGDTAPEWAAVRPSEANLYQLNMGMCIPVSLGLATALPHRRVIALESDGSVLLFMGNLSTLGTQQPPNMMVVIFDNESYSATGGLPSATATHTDLSAVARGCGLTEVDTVSTIEDFEAKARHAYASGVTSLLVAKVDRTMRRGSTGMDGKEAKYHFVRYIERTEGKRIIRSSAMSGLKEP